MRRTWVAVGSALVALVAIGGPEVAGEDAKPDRAQPIRDYLDRCAAHGWSGMVCVVWDDDIVVSHGAGRADRETTRAPTMDTLFEVASITKVFTACAVMRLVEQERLRLDDPIGKHVPDVPGDKAGITLRHLLGHTSGMPRSAAGGGSTPAEATASFLRTPLASKPGERVQYWNGGYALLAAVVENTTGTTFQEALRTLVLEPAGMTHSGFTGDDLAIDEQAMGYDGDVAVRWASHHPYRQYDYGYKGMGGLVTSARDLVQFARAWWGGRVLGEAATSEMLGSPRDNQGLGWGVLSSSRATPRLVHGGDVRGFHSAFEILPAERGAIIVLGNTEVAPAWKLQWNLEALAAGTTPRYPMPPAVATPAEDELDALVGRYVQDGGSEALAIARASGGLRVAEVLANAGATQPGDRTAVLAETARAIVRALQDADEEAIRSRLPDGVFWAASWPGLLVGKLWPDQVRSFGPLASSEVLEIAATGHMGHRAVVALRHEKAERWMNVQFSTTGRIQRLSFDPPGDGIGACYRPAPDGTYHTFDWQTDRPQPVLRFERAPDGSQRVTVQRGATTVSYTRRGE